jgi:fructose-bisphosphate aldolase class II
LRQAFTNGLLEILKNHPDEYHLAISLGKGREFMKEKVKEKIRLFGSSQKALLFSDVVKVSISS